MSKQNFKNTLMDVMFKKFLRAVHILIAL